MFIKRAHRFRRRAILPLRVVVFIIFRDASASAMLIFLMVTISPPFCRAHAAATTRSLLFYAYAKECARCPCAQRVICSPPLILPFCHARFHASFFAIQSRCLRADEVFVIFTFA